MSNWQGWVACPICGQWPHSPKGVEEHTQQHHSLDALYNAVFAGDRSDWPQQYPTHAQIQTDDAYSHQLIPWQDEILAILWRSYDGGQAA